MPDRNDIALLLAEFRQEAKQQLDTLDRTLVKIEEGGELDDESRSELLRQLHTLKGNAAMVGLRPMMEQVHALESIFKEGAEALDPGRIDSLFEFSATLRSAVDHLGGSGQDEAMARVEGMSMPEATSAKPTSAPPLGKAEPATTEAEAEESASETEEPPKGSEARHPRADGRAEFVRVPFEALDELLSRVADLVAIQAKFEELLAHHEERIPAQIQRTFEELSESLNHVAGEFRDTTMELRLVPLESIFGPFPTLVREIARDQGKKARIVIQGESIQMDKTAADALAEPILHLVRNAIDHGIESPEDREKKGKDPAGTVRLEARREGDHIRIEVSDDGRGLDHTAIRRRAAELGMEVPQNDHDLLFATGFSTRKEVTTISGRGIGLDIVRRSVTRLRGSLMIEERGEGVAFVLRMPLTLAIVSAVIFESGGSVFAVATSDVEEMLSPRLTERAAGARVVRRHEAMIPVADPPRLFGWSRPADQSADRPRFPIVVREGERLAAILADRLIDQRNVVIKALPDYLGAIRGISGATVGTDGRVILLIDGAGLLNLNLNSGTREGTA